MSAIRKLVSFNDCPICEQWTVDLASHLVTKHKLRECPCGVNDLHWEQGSRYCWQQHFSQLAERGEPLDVHFAFYLLGKKQKRSKLTDQDKTDILRLSADGYTVQEIREKLGLKNGQWVAGVIQSKKLQDKKQP